VCVLCICILSVHCCFCVHTRACAFAHTSLITGMLVSAVLFHHTLNTYKSIGLLVQNTHYNGGHLYHSQVAMNTLWGMRILILAKPEHMNSISHIQMSQVRTGIGNTLGNKGAVGVSFYLGSTSFCFINSHLTSGNEKCHRYVCVLVHYSIRIVLFAFLGFQKKILVDTCDYVCTFSPYRRNNNFHDILKGLVQLKQKKQLSTFDLTLQFHHLFWFGDLNYRVDLAATVISKCNSVHCSICVHRILLN